MKKSFSAKKGVLLAMALSTVMMSSAHALTVYTAGPGSLAKNLATGLKRKQA
ncbi:extracellular solute-binding protein [Lelliottia amnigena]|nr:extracellular solute-binding protein [Lelliottia amnigena]